MADLTINADDVRNALNEFAASYEPAGAERVEVGRVASAADGIARVEGCLLYTSPSPRDLSTSRMPSSA